jgi:hypothetical protein
MGNCVYLLYAYFSVSAYVSCIPAVFPANFTALVNDISGCVAPLESKHETGNPSPQRAIVAGLLQCVVLLLRIITNVKLYYKTFALPPVP